MSALCRMDSEGWKAAYDVLMALRLEPLADAELVLDGTEKAGFLLGCLTTLVKDGENLESSGCQRLS